MSSLALTDLSSGALRNDCVWSPYWDMYISRLVPDNPAQVGTLPLLAPRPAAPALCCFPPADLDSSLLRLNAAQRARRHCHVDPTIEIVPIPLGFPCVAFAFHLCPVGRVSLSRRLASSIEPRLSFFGVGGAAPFLCAVDILHVNSCLSRLTRWTAPLLQAFLGTAVLSSPEAADNRSFYARRCDWGIKWRGDESQTEVNEDKDVPLIYSRSTLAQTSQQAPTRSWISSTSHLRVCSVALHSVLITIHIALLLIWAKGLEHRVIFPLDQQKRVSLIITAVTTAFGTTYSALLVFVTQTLFMRRSLQITQPLTAIHDTSAAWTGIGSAVLHLWRQMTVPGSALGVTTALLYLGNVLVLHISSPALFSVEAFNTSISVPVGTQNHLPVFNWSTDPVRDMTGVLDNYVKGALYFLPSILANTTSLGLHGGTLYDVIDANEGVGNVQVNATGFNVTCGYPPSMKGSFSGASRDWLWWGVVVDPSDLVIHEFPTTRETSLPFDFTPKFLTSALAEGHMIRPVYNGVNDFSQNLMLYATIQVVDSNETHPPLLELNPPTNDTMAPTVAPSTVQIMQCDLTLVPQTVVLEARTQRVVNVEPNIMKTTSTWAAYTGPTSYDHPPNPTGNLFIDHWMHWYTRIPFVDFEFSLTGSAVWQETDASPDGSNGRSYASDVYLLQQLNLHRPNESTSDPNVTVALHDLENALSRLVAAMFWSTTHFLPFLGPLQSAAEFDAPVNLPKNQLYPVSNMLPLERGSTMVTGTSTLGRLDSSLVAIIAGLVASILLALLALPSIFFNRDNEIPVDGTGVLQAIWMYRNHPELEVLLPQVGHPTTEQLREAGMALQIPEVLSLILGSLHTRPKSKSIRALAVAARTCKVFSEPALDTLWEHQSTIMNVLDCVPGEAWVRFSFDEDEQCEVTLTRELVPADWERALFYARRVKDFTFRDWESGNGTAEALGTLHLCFPQQYLFPNLRALTWRSLDPELLPYVRLFLSPRLRYLHLGLCQSIAHLSLLPLIATQCPLLTDLHINISNDLAPRRHGTSALVAGLTHLRTLMVPSLDRTALEHLGQLPSLTSLTLFAQRPVGFLPRPSSADSRFAALNYLEITVIEDTAVADILALLHNAPIQELAISLPAGIRGRVVAQCYASIAQHCSHDTLTTIRMAEPFHPPDIANADEVAKHVLGAPVGFDLDDALVTQMAQSWPSATTIFLSSNDFAHIPSRVTLPGLLPFAAHCPHLKSLILPLDASVVPPLPSTHVVQKCLTTLGVESAPISDPGEVAGFLSAVFGKLSQILTDVEDETLAADDPAQIAAAERREWWREAEGMLPLMRRTRKRQGVAGP
ncbi:hypothetical protein C8R46DRAFT_1295215 [Mycena filopes]|nr:hypothetical protein C8R46DRAFT_1295215 [Mycena filopes]